MSGSEDFWCGLLDMTVAAALKNISPHVYGCRHVVIRGIDSTRSAREIAKILHRHGLDCDCTASGCVVTGETLYRAQFAGMFTGFDELWFRTGTEKPLNIPDDLVFTSEAVQFGEEHASEIRPLLERNDAFLILADGCGLNYATVDVSIADALRENEPRVKLGTHHADL